MVDEALVFHLVTFICHLKIQHTRQQSLHTLHLIIIFQQCRLFFLDCHLFVVTDCVDVSSVTPDEEDVDHDQLINEESPLEADEEAEAEAVNPGVC